MWKIVSNVTKEIFKSIVKLLSRSSLPVGWHGAAEHHWPDERLPPVWLLRPSCWKLSVPLKKFWSLRESGEKILLKEIEMFKISRTFWQTLSCWMILVHNHKLSQISATRPSAAVLVLGPAAPCMLHCCSFWCCSESLGWNELGPASSGTASYPALSYMSYINIQQSAKLDMNQSFCHKNCNHHHYLTLLSMGTIGNRNSHICQGYG